MARKKKAEDSPGGANWMDTYGDMVTLLLCFFVLLYSFSNLDAAKFEGMASSIQQAFNTNSGPRTVAIPSLSPESFNESPFQAGMIERMSGARSISIDIGDDDDEPSFEMGAIELGILADLLQGSFDAAGLMADVSIDVASFTITVRFTDSIFFDSGSAALRQEAYAVLDSVIEIFLEYDTYINTIRVEGHTDNVPLAGGYRDNWELSHIRAANATRYIYETGRIAPERLSGMGCGEFRPVADNSTPEGRQKNRRVDFVVDSVNIEALAELAARIYRENAGN